MSIQLNQKGIEQLKKELASKLYDGCCDGAEILRDNTPIDTKRLWKSTRPIDVNINRETIRSGIVAGGVSLTGILRETTIQKDVVYAIFVNNRTGYIDNCMASIGSAIEGKLSD